MLLNISSNIQSDKDFSHLTEKIFKSCLIPTTLEGRIKSVNSAANYFRASADKILINNLNFIIQKLQEI